MHMDITEDAARDICTDAVLERGERYRAEGRIRKIHRVDTTVTAVVSGSRQYDVRVDLATDGFAPWCDCPYDGPGTCKHVVAVLLRCVDDLPPDEGDRLDAVLDGADADEFEERNDTEQIVLFLDAHDDRAWKAAMIADRLGLETDAVSAILSRLKQRGVVRHKLPVLGNHGRQGTTPVGLPAPPTPRDGRRTIR